MGDGRLPRGRSNATGQLLDARLRETVAFPGDSNLYAILSLGIPLPIEMRIVMPARILGRTVGPNRLRPLSQKLISMSGPSLEPTYAGREGDGYAA
jgi:hypothetical protein